MLMRRWRWRLRLLLLLSLCLCLDLRLKLRLRLLRLQDMAVNPRVVGSIHRALTIIDDNLGMHLLFRHDNLVLAFCRAGTIAVSRRVGGPLHLSLLSQGLVLPPSGRGVDDQGRSLIRSIRRLRWRLAVLNLDSLVLASSDMVTALRGTLDNDSLRLRLGVSMLLLLGPGLIATLSDILAAVRSALIGGPLRLRLRLGLKL
jgi:hypothetical protein